MSLWDGLLGYWYLMPITGAFAYVGGRTRDRWAPFTCITLLLLVSNFSPPRTEGIDAITITQTLDLSIIGLTLWKRRRVDGASLDVTPPSRGPLLLVLVGVVAGAGLLYVYGCRVGLFFYVPFAIPVAISLFPSLAPFTAFKRVREPAAISRWLSILAGIVLGTAAFGLPALRRLRDPDRGPSTAAWEPATLLPLKALGVSTAAAVALNTLVAYHWEGPSAFAWGVLWPALVGAITGTAFRFRYGIGRVSALWDFGYGMVLMLFVVITVYFLAFRVGLP